MHPDPFEALLEQLDQATPTALAASARACIHRAGAAFEATGHSSEAAAVFGADSLAGIGPQTTLEQLITPVLAAQPQLRRYAVDPETGELPDGDESHSAVMLSMASEQTFQASTEAETDREALRAWAGACSAITLDMNQHIENKDVDPYGDPDDDPGPLTVAELDTQAKILRLLEVGNDDAYSEMNQASQARRTELAAAITDLIEDESGAL